MLSTAAAELLTSDPDTDQAAVAVTQAARTLAPGHKTEWITLLARLATHQPSVLALIPHLTAPLPPAKTEQSVTD